MQSMQKLIKSPKLEAVEESRACQGRHVFLEKISFSISPEFDLCLLFSNYTGWVFQNQFDFIFGYDLCFSQGPIGLSPPPSNSGGGQIQQGGATKGLI